MNYKSVNESTLLDNWLNKLQKAELIEKKMNLYMELTILIKIKFCATARE